MPDKKNARPEPNTIERVIASIGSVTSLFIHTGIFFCFFLLSAFGIVSWELMLLVLTTILSLEAIYLAIFIQITVNRHTESLREVEEDIDEIQEDVEELGEDVGDIQEDLEEISEDIEEISEDIDEIQEDVEELSEEEEEELHKQERSKKDAEKKVVTKTPGERNAELLEKLSKDVARVLADLENLKAGK